MPRIIGLDRAFLRNFARRAKSCRAFDSDSRRYVATLNKLAGCHSSLLQSTRHYSAVISAMEGKRAAAYFAVDQYIQVNIPGSRAG